LGTEFRGGRESQCEELHLHTKEVSPKDTLSHLFDNTAATGKCYAKESRRRLQQTVECTETSGRKIDDIKIKYIKMLC